VKDACRDWALRAIPASDTSIYAGTTTAAARHRLRRALGIIRPNAVSAINAAKATCPECGLPLSGTNAITEPGRRPGTVRWRCRACTQLRKREDYQRRKQAQAAAAAGQ
jgi:transposase-like protein